MNTKTICYVAGKSGGHIIPCLTLADNHNTQEKNNILFFSSNTLLDKTILSGNKNIAWHIMLPLSTRAGSYITTFFNTCSAFIMSFFYLLKHRPKHIITTGGIVAIAPCLAGWILRIPITLYSLDAVPGKAIQFLTSFATTIITPFASSTHYFPGKKCSIADYPIKYNNQIIDQQTALAELKLSPNKKTVLILGGSQGSLFLNECIKKWVQDPSFPIDKIQIIHQTGSLDTTNWKQLYSNAHITAYPFSYHPNLALMYAAADLIICRAGAGTLFEVKFFNKQCIIIPLKTNTTTHQVDNAQAMTNEYPELFQTIEQSVVEHDPNILFGHITTTLNV